MRAAIHAFGDRGFDGASLRQIAGEARADIALTRYYFGSKEALWRAAIDHLADELAEELQALFEAPPASPRERLESVIRWFVDVSFRWPQISRIIVFDGNTEGDRGEYVKRRLVGPFYALVSDLIAEAQDAGSVADVAPRTLFFMITHGGSFPMALPVLTNAFPGGDIHTPRSLKAHADAIVGLVFKDE